MPPGGATSSSTGGQVRQQGPPPPPPTAAPRGGAALNHSRTSAVQQPLNVSTITQGQPKLLLANGINGPHRMSNMSMLNTTPLASVASSHHNCSSSLAPTLSTKHRVGAREALTSLGLLCLGKWSISLARPSRIIDNHQLFFHKYSLAPAGSALADIPAENIAGRTRTAATAAGSHFERGLCDCVRCDVGPVRAVLITESLLSAGVCHTVPVCGETSAGATDRGTVSTIFSASYLILKRENQSYLKFLRVIYNC